MSSGSGDKPGGGSSPGRPAADTPGRLVVRSLDGHDSSMLGASDTAVAVAANVSPSSLLDTMGAAETPAAGTPSLTNLTDLVGTTLSDRYLVTRKVGQGGMGAVYEATHTLIGKRVAVKVLLEKYAQREAIVARLKQEAQLASSIGNEHIIDITDFGNTDDGRTFVVMEFLEGESMAECLARESKLPEQRILHIAHQAASALAAAHDKGVVHRDIKPENVFLLRRKETDFVKVVDFGISKSLRASSEEEEQPRLTQTGMVLGTPLYMSPEQARGDEDLDHRVDIYALGVIMYEAACGRVPFSGNNYLSVISQVLNEEPTHPRELRPELSEEFEAIVMRAMAKERDERYASAKDMLADLGAVLDDPTHSTERAKITGPRRLLPRRPKVPRLAWAVGGAGVAVGGVTLAVVLLMGSPKRPAPAQPAVAPTVETSREPVEPKPAPPPVEPAIETITLRIVTDPPNAIVYRESEVVGPAPTDLKLVRRDKEVRIVAQLDGYNEAEIMINPAERKDGQTIPLKLFKPKKGPPKITKMKPAGGEAGGSVQTPVNATGGELGNNPFGGGGTIPRK
jgi:eukaryotic-like serine/threonine-protein kinase